MPLDMAHIHEICTDIKQQCEQGVTEYPLFCMTLVPEGTPPADKVGKMVEKFLAFKEELHGYGVKCGILVQASIGHGYPLNAPSPFKKYVNLNNGKEEAVCCPYDDDFCSYFKGVMKTLAEAEPDIMMLDDDFRLIFREGNGCACQMHMDRFNELAGTDITREELYEVLQHDNHGRYAEIFVETQKESLIKAAKAMREGIDAVNPSLVCACCTSGASSECPVEVAEILAGNGNPAVLRAHNGSYVPTGTRLFTQNFYRLAIQRERFNGIQYIIAESDTCPQNRYACNAQWIHSHFVGSVLEGASGAKRWMTRLGTFEPESGLAYRKIFAKNRAFYEELAKIVPQLKWQGCRVPLNPRNIYTYSDCGWNSCSDDGDAWSSYVLEKYGLPVYFSAQKGGLTFLSGTVDQRLADAEIKDLLQGPVVLTSEIADRLNARGFAEYIGVKVQEWKGKQPSYEKILLNGKQCALQKNSRQLLPLNDKVEKLSVVYNEVEDCDLEELYAASTLYRNPSGGTVIVFAGTPIAGFNYWEGFSFLTQSRKAQFIDLLKRFDCLPIYYVGDEEVYLKSAECADGRRFCAVFNLGYDVIEEIVLHTEEPVREIEMLCEDGSLKRCSFREENGNTVVGEKAMPLNPVILFIK